MFKIFNKFYGMNNLIFDSQIIHVFLLKFFIGYSGHYYDIVYNSIYGLYKL